MSVRLFAGGVVSFLLAGLVFLVPTVVLAQDRLVSPEEVIRGDIPPIVTLDKGGAPVPWNPEQVSEFQLVDQTGEPVTRETLLGRPWVANFVFTRCSTACPATCRKIMELNDLVSDVDVRFVTITVDPEHDTPELMANFAAIWQADPARWLFCTGEPGQVQQLIRNGFKVTAWENFGTDRMPGYEFAHDNHLIHIDAQGRILGRYNSIVDDEVVLLTRVLKGDMETPKKNRPAVLDAPPPPLIVEDPLEALPGWARRLPAINALLNGLATLFLLGGLAAIKKKNAWLHQQLMISAFGLSILFLACYLTYHGALHHYTGTHGKAFSGTGTVRTVYFTILISHVVLAALVPVLAIVTLVKAFRQNWTGHRQWAKVTFPIWLYVSVTGVIIYWMLYQL